ncbi:MAG: hypothetical protein A2Z20_03715 [Bdellovibrionales bacterium RBG_16_40_8]|nr:MAG: hypothetical protein A2Z20_03715 [Bdellovibrionales bacterium RBG_16_40_8]
MRNNYISIISVISIIFCFGCAKHQNELLPLELGSFAVKPKTITIRIKNYNPRPGQEFQNLFVSNYSVIAELGSLQLSSARDGLSDFTKNQKYITNGFATFSAESVLPGIADIFLFYSGIVSSQYYTLYCSQSLMQNSSNDAFVYDDTSRPNGYSNEFLGLRDCVKYYMGLNPALFDYDNDGIPDYLEVRAGLNPANKYDAYLSTAGDGVLNIDKVKRNIPIDENAYTQPNQIFSYKYETQVNIDNSRDFIISNIPVLNNGIENFISFNLTEYDISDTSTSIYTAFMIIKNVTTSAPLEIGYWATDPTKYYNQQIIGF